MMELYNMPIIITPYFNSEITRNSIITAKENIIYHLLAYIAAKNKEELAQFKVAVSFMLMEDILRNRIRKEDKTPAPLMRRRFKIYALKHQKLPNHFFDLYNAEYQSYEQNDGDYNLAYGMNYKDLENHLLDNASAIMTVYFLTYNLLRLAKRPEAKHAMMTARKLTNQLYFAIEKDNNKKKEKKVINISFDKIEKARKEYIAVAPLIFGYVYTLIKHHYIQIRNLEDKKVLNQSNFENALSNLDGTKIFKKYHDIIGYTLYAQGVLTDLNRKYADTETDWAVLKESDLEPFNFKESTPILPKFTDSELKIIEN